MSDNTIYPFVFSNNSKYRIARHSLFWLCWILYYSVFTAIDFSRDHSVVKSFFSALFETTVSTPMDMIYCYSIIYFLLPKYLFKGKYIQMVLLWLLFSVLFVITFHLYAIYFLPFIRQICGMPVPVISQNFTWIFFSLFSQINMEGCLAAAIKLGKMWYIKQQEFDLIKNEKQKIEPQISDGQMPPVFLISAMDKVESLTVQQPAAIPDVIKKIKDFLIYVIYDSNQPRVPVETEIKLLEEYIELEKISTKENLNISLKILISKKGGHIAPSILLPLVENSFKQLVSYDLQQKNIEIVFNLDDTVFSIDIAFSKPADTSTLMNSENALFKNISKRLQLIYPQSHDFKITIRPSQFIIHLRISLNSGL